MSTKIREYGTCNLCNHAFWKKDLIRVRDLSGMSWKDVEKPTVFLCKWCYGKLDSPVGVKPVTYGPNDIISGLPI